MTTFLQVITMLIISSVLLRRPFRDTSDDMLRADFTLDVAPRNPEFYARYVQTRRHWLLFIEKRTDQNGRPALWSHTCYQYPWPKQTDDQRTAICLDVIADAIKLCSELINNIFAVLRHHKLNVSWMLKIMSFCLLFGKLEHFKKICPIFPHILVRWCSMIGVWWEGLEEL